MAIMNYETPNITKIDFEDSIFVTTECGFENKEIENFIVSQGGIIKGSVTKSTNYLIYGDGKEETAKYRKALDLIQEKGLAITMLPMSLFLIACRGKGLVEFGTYPFDADGTPKPIKWVILNQDGERSLLFSAFELECKPYHSKKFADITWDRCSLRKWLNEDFYSAAFSAAEQQKILTTRVRTENHPQYGTFGGNEIDDKVFLLSIEEIACNTTEFTRRIKPTPFVMTQIPNSWAGYDWWWLRSPGYCSGSASSVDPFGRVSLYGDRELDTIRAVCPALWVELE